jgi:hypothetical protein
MVALAPEVAGDSTSPFPLRLPQTLEVLGVPFMYDRVTVRIKNFSPITPLRALKSNFAGRRAMPRLLSSPLLSPSLTFSFADKFVTLRGNVVRVSSIKPLVKEMVFKCAKCGTDFRRAFIGTTVTSWPAAGPAVLTDDVLQMESTPRL